MMGFSDNNPQVKTWVCVICGHRHKGDSPPSVCPECGAHKEMFQEEK